MRYYIIAGEASGDLHGSNLIKELLKVDSEADIRAWGGDQMQQAGAFLVKHIRDLAFMGFLEVISNLKTILKNLDLAKKDILSWKPDLLILIDYPGFNLRIAEFASQNNLKVVYYISPQVWAWKQNRVIKIKKWVNLMLVILPFEKEFYKKWNYDVSFVGHPLLDAVNNISFNSKKNSSNKKVALLPGSRKQEIKQMLPEMACVASEFKNIDFIVAAAPAIPLSYYSEFNLPANVSVVKDNTYLILAGSDAALVTSGTATLETALIGTPQVVCYRGNPVSYLLAKRLVKVKYISLVNLILDQNLVTELIQNDMNCKRVISELKSLLYDENERNKMLNGYKLLQDKLGGKGASARAAREIYSFAKNYAV